MTFPVSKLSDSLSKLIEYDANDNPEYIGEASPGTLSSQALWKITKITYDANSNPTEIFFADGDASHSKVWDDRATYTYS